MIWVHFDISFETQYLLEKIWYKQIGEGFAEEYFLALKIKNLREGSKLIPVTPTARILLEVWFPFVNSSFVAVDVPI